MANNRKKVLIAMSGGIDSTVAAALLKRRGYNATGVFIFFQTFEKVKQNYISAKQAAKLLDIPLKTIDMATDFKKVVIDNFILEYKKGNTPNPCIRCNKYLKFGRLLDFSKKLNCDFLATGHYSRIKKGNKAYKLITAKDKNKDQSYFLYELNQEKLRHLLFPLGSYKKSEVKKIAKKIGFSVYKYRESSDLCFMNTDLSEFLSHQIKASKGDILDMDGKKIGQHIGLHFYTLGQRRGIKIGGTGPYYVVGKDFKKNQLRVTNNPKDPRLFSNKLFVKDINWISGNVPKFPYRCLAQHRYQTRKFRVKISKTQGRYLIEYKTSQRAITPGQSIVLYKPLGIFGDSYEVLGGGIIEMP